MRRFLTNENGHISRRRFLLKTESKIETPEHKTPISPSDEKEGFVFFGLKLRDPGPQAAPPTEPPATLRSRIQSKL